MKNVIPENLSSVISVLRESGCRIRIKGSMVHVAGPVRLRAVDIVRTLPYPGFPTDMQAQLVAMLTTARGTSIMVETVFENRYKHVDELLRMGANIKLEGRIAVIKESEAGRSQCMRTRSQGGSGAGPGRPCG